VARGYRGGDCPRRPQPEDQMERSSHVELVWVPQKVEGLLKSIDDGSLSETLRTSQPDEIPRSVWPRVVGVCEQMYVEAKDAFERLCFLRLLRGFGGTNIASHEPHEN
jgi:hypothetical protein